MNLQLEELTWHYILLANPKTCSPSTATATQEILQETCLSPDLLSYFSGEDETN